MKNLLLTFLCLECFSFFSVKAQNLRYEIGLFGDTAFYTNGGMMHTTTTEHGTVGQEPYIRYSFYKDKDGKRLQLRASHPDAFFLYNKDSTGRVFFSFNNGSKDTLPFYMIEGLSIELVSLSTPFLLKLKTTPIQNIKMQYQGKILDFKINPVYADGFIKEGKDFNF